MLSRASHVVTGLCFAPFHPRCACRLLSIHTWPDVWAVSAPQYDEQHCRKPVCTGSRVDTCISPGLCLGAESWGPMAAPRLTSFTPDGQRARDRFPAASRTAALSVSAPPGEGWPLQLVLLCVFLVTSDKRLLMAQWPVFLADTPGGERASAELGRLQGSNAADSRSS